MAAGNSYSVSGIVIWLIVGALVLYGLKAIGRLSFGVVVLVSMLFFTIFLLDNYTLHDLRQYVDLSTYDETLEDPQGKVNEIAELAGKQGEVIVEEVDDFGNGIDNTLGIEREDNTKEWGSVSKKESKESEETKESKGDVSEKESNVSVDSKEIIIAYTQINKTLQEELNNLSKQDKSIIESMTPSVKLTLKGEQITVTNEDDSLEDSQLKITVN